MGSIWLRRGWYPFPCRVPRTEGPACLLEGRHETKETAEVWHVGLTYTLRGSNQRRLQAAEELAASCVPRAHCRYSAAEMPSQRNRILARQTFLLL